MSSAVTLDAAKSLSTRKNNFRIIRHAAAAGVIFSHAYIVNGGLGNLQYEPLEAWTGISIAEIAVNVFFITSGFLVTQSILKRGSILAYAISRALRIYPALLTIVALTALVLGPIVTDLQLAAYFGRPVLGYLFYDGTALLPHKMRYGLPGVFADNPYPNVVNASLWTLPWEIWMYVVLGAIFLLRLIKRRIFAMLWAILVSVFVLEAFDFVELSIYALIAVRFLTYFFTGAIFYRFWNILQPTPWRQAAVIVIFAGVTPFIGNEALLPFALTHTVLFLATWKPIVSQKLSEGADLSYGMYLYAYPIQQLLVLLLGPHDPFLNTTLSVLLVVPLAALSWFIVEKPALAVKARTITFLTASFRNAGA